MYNRVTICGRLTRKPELFVSGSGIEYTFITIAVNQYSREKNKVSYIDATAWRNNAVNICKFLDKGSLLLIDGQLQNDRNNKMFLSVNSVQFLDKKQTPTSQAVNEPTTKITQVEKTSEPTSYAPEKTSTSNDSNDTTTETTETKNKEPLIDWDEK